MHGTLAGVIRSEGAVSVRYPVRPKLDAWVLPEGSVPQSIPHQDAVRHLELVLVEWVRRTGRKAAVANDLAVRWLPEAPRTGIDPDVCLLEPPPPGFHELSSLCTWKPGHVVPPICFEVVSESHPYKDYLEIQDRYAAMGTRELVVFDPLLAGPSLLGGPVPLQIWRRDAVGLFERVHYSDAPAFSDVLGAWLCPRGRLLELANDREGREIWPTGEERAQAEAERAQAEAERAKQKAEQARVEAERERAAREDVERRLALLEQRLRER